MTISDTKQTGATFGDTAVTISNTEQTRARRQSVTGRRSANGKTITATTAAGSVAGMARRAGEYTWRRQRD